MSSFDRYTFDDPLAKLNQRITDLETMIQQVAGGPKLGLADTQMANGTAGFEITSFGISNWVDDAGDKTPQITMTTGSRVLIFGTWTPTFYGSDLGTVGVNDQRSQQPVAGVQIDSTEPQSWPLPPMMQQVGVFVNATEPFIWLPAMFFTFREDLIPGEHTFTLRFYAIDNSPTGTINPLINDTRLIVVPLGWQ